VKKYPDVGRHLRALYGRNKYAGRHASGVIIGDDLPRETALWVASKRDDEDDDDSDKIVQTSFTEGIVNKNLQAMGFVKFDILSIATLKIIHYALKLISDRTGIPLHDLREKIRPHNLDLNDHRVMKHVFWEGNMGGVFQFTGRGIRNLAKQVKPDKFDDVSAIVSLYRPGPLDSGMAELFVKNKNHPDQVTYEHEIIKELMESTRGTMIFQEQLMRLCNRLGKMELKDVQRIRKNLLKKIKGRSEEFLKAEDAELSGKFVKGCVENGMTEERAREWWANIKGWGSYGFNKSLANSELITTYSQNGEHVDRRLEHVQPGMLLRSRDEKTNKDVFVHVLAKHNHGILDLVEIELDDGKKIRCTWDHKFRTTTGEMLPLNEIFKRDLELVNIAVEDKKQEKFLTWMLMK
jgi:DNA polymerase-3 subunit alpha